MEIWIWSVLGGILVLATFLLAWPKDPARRARFLRRVGFALMAIFSILGGLFIAGETFSDPGGWAAAGMIAAWAGPLVVLALAAWYRPGRASRLFAVLTAGVVGLGVWAAIAPEAWRTFENRNGPVRAVAIFALAAAVSVLGLRRTGAAGVMLVVIGVVPAALASLYSVGGVSIGVVSAPAVVAGVLYLLSAAVRSRAAAPPTRREEEAQPERPSRAA